jgi:hypothetical protein
MAKRPEAFAAMADEHLRCRAWYHAWEPVITYVSMVGRQQVYELHLRCLRCDAERIDERTVKGLVRRAYRHPDGYLVGNLKAWGGRSTFTQNVHHELLSRMAVPKPEEVEDGNKRRQKPRAHAS